MSFLVIWYIMHSDADAHC